MNQSLLENALRLRRAGRLDEAADIYVQILREEPRHFEALHALGIVRYQAGRLEEAERLIMQATIVNPASPDASYNRACLLQKLNRPEEALLSFDQAIAMKPDYLEALVNRGSLLGRMNRHADALESFDTVVALRSTVPEVWSNRASALLGLGRAQEALESADRALALKPHFGDAWKNRGFALAALQRLDDALACFDKALALAPGDPELLGGLAMLLLQLNRFREASSAFEKYLTIVPGDADAWHRRGFALQRQKRMGDALACFDRALQLAPEDFGARTDRANLLYEVEQFEDAAEEYQRVLDGNPEGPPYVRAYLTLSRLHCCDWRALKEEHKRIAADVSADGFVLDPTANAWLSFSLDEQFRTAETWMRENYPPAPAALWRGERYRHDRIRIAYLSADFRMHATAWLMAGVFENHDRTRFETTAISFSGGSDESVMRGRLVAAFDRFLDVDKFNDLEVAQLLREAEIDIAIDLKGYTAHARPGILAHRAVPVQAHYLGFPGTMAAEYVDYIIADKIVIPEAHQPHYSEKMAYLPDSYQCNDRKRQAAPIEFQRAEAGLPENGFVFCCFNNNQKILPEMFDIWMRLLQGVPNSVLWLLADNVAVIRNLKREADARGIPEQRLIFAPRLSPPEHLARQRLADLFLDTLPYNAHTTASDALWEGLPVLTSPGPTFASRVGASLLVSAGLPELIAPSLDVYEALALKLAREPKTLADIKAKLVRNRDTCPLFDTVRITRSLEAVYTRMHERHLMGEPPGHFEIAAPS